MGSNVYIDSLRGMDRMSGVRQGGWAIACLDLCPFRCFVWCIGEDEGDLEFWRGGRECLALEGEGAWEGKAERRGCGGEGKLYGA